MEPAITDVRLPGLEAMCQSIPIARLWSQSQLMLPNVVRWGGFYGRGKCRRQDDLEHSHSVQLAGSFIIGKLKKHLVFDSDLLRDALLLHEMGEAILQRDVLANIKNGDPYHDAREYAAFLESIESIRTLDSCLYDYYQKAFLLQFCLGNGTLKGFPEPAYALMRQLASECRIEALLFKAIERWDYVLFAYEQAVQRQSLLLLVGVLHDEMTPLNQLALELPPFGREIWTPEVEQEAGRFVANHPELLAEYQRIQQEEKEKYLAAKQG